MQRHLSLRRGELGPVADPPQMSAVTQADHGNSALGGLSGPKVAGEFADDLPKAAITVDDGHRVAIEHDARRLVRAYPSRMHPFEVFADADDAVRIVADQIGIHQPARDRRGFLIGTTGATHDGGDESDKYRRCEESHGRGSGGPFPLEGGRTGWGWRTARRIASATPATFCVTSLFHMRIT